MNLKSKRKFSFFLLVLFAGILVSVRIIAEKPVQTEFLNNFFHFSSAADPTASFTFTPNGDCADKAIKFTNTSTGDGLTYLWSFGDASATSTLSDPTHIFLNVFGDGEKSFSVTLTVKAADGKTATTNQSVKVKLIPDLKIGSDQPPKVFEGLPYFVSCTNQDTDFLFLNQSTTKASNKNYTIDWGDGSPKFTSTNWSSEKHFYKKGIYQVTYIVEGLNGCVITEKFGVFVGSNPAVGLATPGNTNICIGEPLTFTITGTENNPVGTIYKVSFSDGSLDQVFTHPPPATVTHIYQKTSCGALSNPTFKNYFAVKILATNPCESSVAQVEPIYVTEPIVPKIKITENPVCVNTPVSIENESNFFVDASNSGSCSDNGKFVWEISPATGWTLAPNSLGERPVPGNPNTWSSGLDVIKPVFNTPGTYTVKLIIGNKCGITETIKTICVIPKPESSFTLEKTEVCGPATIKATNTSNILGACGTTNPNTFTWTVTYSKGNCGTTSNVEFIGGSNKNSESPGFLFKNPGIYTIRLTIAASCGQVFKEEKVTVTAPPTISISTIPNSCGPTTLTPKATVGVCDSGTPTYKWTFEGGVPATSSSLDPGPVTFSSPGPKKITLEVISSCGTTTSEKTFTINGLPVVDAGTDTEICNGEDIKLTGTASGGAGPFTYQWTSTPTSSIPGSNTASPTVKPNQTTVYKLAVKNQTTNCISTDEVEIKVIPAPIIQFDIPNQEICSGETTKTVNLTTNPSGESISWTSVANGAGGVLPNGTNQIPGQPLVNNTANPIDVVYTAIITNSSSGNCALVPAKYTIRVYPAPVYMDHKLSTCSDQSFDFKPTANITGSTFTWTVLTPAGISGATNSNLVTSIKQQLRNSTNTPLDVIYTITPFLGSCPGNPFELTVTVQPAPSINFTQSDQVLCTGAISKPVRFSSEVAGTTFLWIADKKGMTGVIESGTGNEIPAQTLINPTNQPITIEYKVSVSTNTGSSCSGVPKTYRITVNPSITLTEQIPSFNGFGISCAGANDGSIKLSPEGGNGIFTYSWNGPTGFASSSMDLSNLKPGSYQVSISDQFGCVISRTYQITEPQPLIATVISKNNILCAGDESGAIEISVSGGTTSLPFQFEWKRNGIPISANSQNLAGIPSGTYEVKIKDANGCFKILSGIQLTEPAAALVINYSKTDISCYGANDGSLKLDVSGGLPPYNIKWNFGSGQSGFDNLGPGDYTLTVSDKSGCIRTQTITIEDAPLLKITPEVKNISCFGQKDGFIKLNLEGKLGSTTIRWDNGEEREDLFNLIAGVYGVTIKDQSDCEIRSVFNIVEPALLQIEPKIKDALVCDTPQSGEINLGISGGTPPYIIQWSNGQSVEILLGITAGQYAVKITDALGCQVNQSFEVKRPSPISIVTLKSTNIQCGPRLVEEEFKISISGGFAPYTINWSGGNISPDGKTMKTSAPGLYEVSVTDGRGCSSVQSFEVENLEIIPEAAIESAAFEQYNSYLVNFEIQFLNKSFGQITSYFWDFGDGKESFEENPKHTYTAEGNYEITLTITDVFGCSAVVKKKISVFDYYLVVPNAFTPNGDGINDTFFPRYINIESLQFWILNKWGETIYFSDDMNSQGWDGKINGVIATPGNYVYRLKFQTLDGRTQTQTDLFILLK